MHPLPADNANCLAEEIYVCASDTRSVADNTLSVRMKRSYAINGGFTIKQGPYLTGISTVDGYSVQVSEVNNSAGIIMIGERFNTGNILGAFFMNFQDFR